MNLIIDENLPPRWCDYLAPLGITASHWRDVGKSGDADDTIFDYACEHEAVIVTQDLDFTADTRIARDASAQCHPTSRVCPCS